MRRITRQQLGQFSTILLDTVRNCMLRHGMSKDQFDSILMNQKVNRISRAPFRYAKRGKHVLSDGGAYGAVLRTWRTQRKYVDENGNPRELPKESKTVCLNKLLRAHGFRGIETEATSYLRKMGAIARTKTRKFILVESSSAKIPVLDESACIHTAKCIDAHISTILFNLGSSDPKQRLPEKRTEVLLPVGLHNEFREFAQRQLTSVAHTIDDWLETKAARIHPRTKRYPAGALLVGYSGNPIRNEREGKKEAKGANRNSR